MVSPSSASVLITIARVIVSPINGITISPLNDLNGSDNASSLFTVILVILAVSFNVNVLSLRVVTSLSI